MAEIPPEVASLLACRGWLRQVLEREFRRNGGRVPYPLERWLDQLERERRIDRITDQGNGPTFPPEETVSVTEFAATSGTTVQAVRARCRRGTLPATRVDGAWRIFTEGTTDAL
jgi:hypothetical protein